MARYRFTRVWAMVLTMIGYTAFVLGFVAAGVVVVAGPQIVPGAPGFERPAMRAALTVACLLGGVVVGAPFIVVGQLLDAFLDQRVLLARIHRRLQPRRPESVTAPEDIRSRLFSPRATRR